MARISRYSFREGVPPRGVTTSFFVLKYQKNQLGISRIAVIVSKKIDKRATARNTLKRRIRYALRNLLDDSSVDIVIYTRKPAGMASYQQLFEHLQQILKKIDII